MRETHSADVPLHPADRPLKRFEAIELDPDTFLNRRPFNKLDLTSVCRTIEQTDAKWLKP